MDALSKSNSAYFIVLLKPFAERTGEGEDVNSIIAKVRAQGAAIREANIVPFNVPPIIGLGTGGGFEYQLLDQRGGDPADLAAVARGLIFAANQDPKLRAVFTTYSASTPQLFLDIDRDKVQTLGHQPGRRVQRAAGDARAATTSTTSICSAAPGSSTCRPSRKIATRSTTSTGSMSAT